MKGLKMQDIKTNLKRYEINAHVDFSYVKHERLNFNYVVDVDPDTDIDEYLYSDKAYETVKREFERKYKFLYQDLLIHAIDELEYSELPCISPTEVMRMMGEKSLFDPSDIAES